ncbi:hypothetical protein [Aquimarina algicola]|uniref:Uncharacterized protein n=1 Tax=Aquimarina algicola TaxID=2589995 RepID=A0A504J9Q6_9FLAO|nr:hypothetical protein [Aquimarina algicola]TPN82931.1 hypothetical protein FHK87_21125 [Aquimarina algicola]
MKNTQDTIKKEQKRRFKAFVKALEQISSRYGVAIDTIEAAYVLDAPLKITYELDEDSGALASVFIGKETFI